VNNFIAPDAVVNIILTGFTNIDIALRYSNFPYDHTYKT
jgi:hypothetical protein